MDRGNVKVEDETFTVRVAGDANRGGVWGHEETQTTMYKHVAPRYPSYYRHNACALPGVTLSTGRKTIAQGCAPVLTALILHFT
jgi:hypothetical protein